MQWTDREIRSKTILDSNLTDNEKEIIKLVVNSAVKEQLNPNGRGLYFEGIQEGAVRILTLLGREDLIKYLDYEWGCHDELV